MLNRSQRSTLTLTNQDYLFVNINRIRMQKKHEESGLQYFSPD